ncbi:hypothetical protein AKK44_05420 [Streptococcus phocae]|uniref:Uncharacterized protein n=1 Tax=Streptococcus phocae TaxID=119224 RepID=A0A0P6SDW1_9STRE|nr:hypothetical protein AKK44_05420 [Streptococcus phocae]
MCRWLNIPRSSYYYQAVEHVSETEIDDNDKTVFLQSKSRYDARKVKKRLESKGLKLSSSKASPDMMIGKSRNVWNLKD